MVVAHGILVSALGPLLGLGLGLGVTTTILTYFSRFDEIETFMSNACQNAPKRPPKSNFWHSRRAYLRFLEAF